ncbi:redox-sensitive transcriptional activator SoxR [Arthrobacter koreensis]|uniref:Redox-sensitive transcriptional activator SoxR n=1 Tax=Arthrobacter koreensis TaxID=199136 RepID=A0ABY6FRX6_9MICC|nr:redox-sensitive transcriptional activator SoxR [Arthrobacter koreensis]MEB7447315.1 redox-sensitive transcriptional activator SoxR [Arthrobacter koreensis]UYB35937.1 redox-sensitive transcriptional activator SoxR [Arthrobacter koreensis]
MTQPKPEALLPISVVSARSGLAVSAIRYYEERGLVNSPRRVAGRRVYHRTVLRRLAFIAAAQKIGLTIAEIQAAMAELPIDRAPSPKEWARLSQPWKERIDQRIAELEGLRMSLEDCIGCGCLSMTACGILNPQDQAAEEGSGARWSGRRKSPEA